jgi:hypothetical protein
MMTLGSTELYHRHPEVRAQRASKDERHGRWPFILRDARSALLRMTDRQSASVNWNEMVLGSTKLYHCHPRALSS